MVAQIASTDPIPTFAPILVLGEVGDEDARGELTTLANDVTAELGKPTTIATSLDYGVRDFGAVVTFPGFLEDVTATVLWVEALEAGVPVIAPEIRREWLRCNACHKVRLFGNVRTEWDENGWILDETLCAPCDYRTPGCMHCLTADVPTVPVADGEGGWRPYCSPCATAHTRRARRPRRTARKALVAA
ncbi:hypothetical protein [Streptomyces violaceusniger]|uniref:hypothetical protein n=1 Tax=Streptomyces violaceusniger TaxID=68280 RepID=UPI00382E1AA9